MAGFIRSGQYTFLAMSTKNHLTLRRRHVRLATLKNFTTKFNNNAFHITESNIHNP